MTGWRLRKDERQRGLLEQKRMLVAENHKAHEDWMCAQHRLDWVILDDQINYAIFALEAAEKRYEMLLRLAKQLTWDNSPVSYGSEG